MVQVREGKETGVENGTNGACRRISQREEGSIEGVGGYEGEDIVSSVNTTE